MDYSIIAGPVIGAVIGYFTNYLAIKMMFRPAEEKRIGKIRIPFTPGIIPRRKDAMAKSIGKAIGENLLDKNTLEKVLLSNEAKNQIRVKLDEELNKHRNDEKSIQDLILNYVDEADYLEDIVKIENKLSKKVLVKLEKMDIGEIISEKVVEIILEKMNGVFILNKFTGKVADSIHLPVKNAVNAYFEQNGEELIKPAVSDGIKSVTQTTVGKVITKVEHSSVDIGDIVMRIYENIINEKLQSMLYSLNISEIIENKIKSMNMEEVEELTFKTIKKELNAIVNLGAVIGFVLGLLNVLF